MGNLKAMCSIGISGMIADMISFGTSGAGIFSACDVGIQLTKLGDNASETNRSSLREIWTQGVGGTVSGVRRLEDSSRDVVNEQVSEKPWRAHGFNMQYSES